MVHDQEVIHPGVAIFVLLGFLLFAQAIDRLDIAAVRFHVIAVIEAPRLVLGIELALGTGLRLHASQTQDYSYTDNRLDRHLSRFLCWYAECAPMLLGRFGLRAGFVTVRQTFVRRCQSRTVSKGSA